MRTLRQAGADVAMTESTGIERCRILASQVVANGDTVVAVGGDGMVRSLLEPVVDSGATMGIIPAGRGNDFARQLAIPADPEVAARVLLKGKTRAVDVIEASGEYLAGSVYAGIDSLTSQIVNRGGPLPSSMQYPVAAIRALLSGHSTTFEVTIDGQHHRVHAFMVVCANSGFYGSGMHIAPHAKVDDGELDVIIVNAASKLGLLRRMPRLYKGTHIELEAVTVLRGREISIASADPVVAYGDGERLSALPVGVRIHPGALTVLG